MKRLLFKLFLFCAVLMTGRSLFDCGMPARADLLPEPPEFRRVLILFPAEAGPRAQEEFMAGLAEVREQHEAEYRELMRKWRETEPERKVRKQAELDRIAEQFGENWWEDWEDPDVFSMLPEEREMMYVHPSFLYETEVFPVRIENSFHSSVVLPDDEFGKLYEAKGQYSAVIVVASDGIAKSIANLLDGDYDNDFKTKNLNDELVVVFAGVSSFDEKLRRYTDTRDSERKELNSFAIVHPADPWPNVDLALRAFPNTKKIVLLASRMNWDEKKEAALRDMLGPGKTLKTVLLPDSVTPSDFVPGDYSRTMRQQYPSLAEVPGKEIEAFRAAVQAEAQPDTVIVSLSSFEWGIDPVEWLPADFDACPIFADTPPTRKNAVGGFCRSMKKLAVQVGDLLEELEKAPLEASRQNIPMTIPESDDLWLNEAAQKRYRLDRLDDFQENVIVANTTTKKAPRMRVYPTWTKKRIFALLAANAAVLGGLALITLLSIRARRRRRNLAEKVYESLPVRVLVTDREGRIIDYHMQYGEMEQTVEVPWRNITSVPWLQDIDAGKAVREAFDTGRTIVREYEIDGERRVVVLSSTPSDVFGRAAVIAVSSDSPQQKPQA